MTATATQPAPAEATVQHWAEVVKLGLGDLRKESAPGKADQLARAMLAAAKAIGMECAPSGGHFYLLNKGQRLRIWEGSLRELFDIPSPLVECQVSERMFFHLGWHGSKPEELCANWPMEYALCSFQMNSGDVELGYMVGSEIFNAHPGGAKIPMQFVKEYCYRLTPEGGCRFVSKDLHRHMLVQIANNH